MIPQAAITAWGTSCPWPSSEAVEQDLLLARAIVEVYRHPLLRDELAESPRRAQSRPEAVQDNLRPGQPSRRGDRGREPFGSD